MVPAYIGHMDTPLEFLIEPVAGQWTVSLGCLRQGTGFARADDAVQWASRIARLLWLDRQLASVVRVRGDEHPLFVAAIFGPGCASPRQSLNSDAQ